MKHLSTVFVLISLFSFSVFLAGCVAEPKKPTGDFLSKTKAGGKIRINYPLLVPAGEVRATLQYSKQLPLPGAANKYEPYCQMVVNTIDKEDKEIPAMDFYIKRVVRDEEPFSNIKNTHRTMIASTSDDLSFMTSGAITTWLIKTYFYLESEQYPDIYRLVCGQAWDSYLSRRMYMSEFEDAVGKFISIIPATEN